MYCKNCGNPMDDHAAVCVKCGVSAGAGNHYCQNCGAQVTDGQLVCIQCGAALGKNDTRYGCAGQMNKSRVAAGILGIVVGGLGIHNFYLGFHVRGAVQLVLTLLSCGLGSVWGFVEGILILTGRINYDAQGLPLAE